MPIDVETADSEQCKEVYARFGLAAYLAQCFEKSLEVFLLLDRKLTDREMTLQKFDALQTSLQKKTLGSLIKEFRKYVEINDEYERVLTDALDKRNFLTHHYFWERAAHFMSEGGRNLMIDELFEMADHFQRADIVVRAMYEAIGKVLGLTEDMIQQAGVKLQAKVASLTERGIR
jgi:hypothetical protein